MPRGPRLDAPDALHHVIARGIERCAIFEHDCDRQDFLDRLARGVERTHTGLLAWCLMPNHFHLLLRTGRAPLSTVMRRLLAVVVCGGRSSECSELECGVGIVGSE